MECCYNDVNNKKQKTKNYNYEKINNKYYNNNQTHKNSNK